MRSRSSIVLASTGSPRSKSEYSGMTTTRSPGPTAAAACASMKRRPSPALSPRFTTGLPVNRSSAAEFTPNEVLEPRPAGCVAGASAPGAGTCPGSSRGSARVPRSACTPRRARRRAPLAGARTARRHAGSVSSELEVDEGPGGRSCHASSVSQMRAAVGRPAHGTGQERSTATGGADAARSTRRPTKAAQQRGTMPSSSDGRDQGPSVHGPRPRCVPSTATASCSVAARKNTQVTQTNTNVRHLQRAAQRAGPSAAGHVADGRARAACRATAPGASPGRGARPRSRSSSAAPCQRPLEQEGDHQVAARRRAAPPRLPPSGM